MTYSEKLKDPQWQKKRLQILERDGFRCVECGSDKNTLHVHHRYYVSGREPWDYPVWSYLSLCEDCHSDQKGSNAEWSSWELLIAGIYMGGGETAISNLEYEVWLQRESEEGNHIPHAAITFTQAGGEE